MTAWVLRCKRWLSVTNADPLEQIDYLRQLKTAHQEEIAEIDGRIGALMLEEFQARHAVTKKCCGKCGGKHE